MEPLHVQTNNSRDRSAVAQDGPRRRKSVLGVCVLMVLLCLAAPAAFADVACIAAKLLSHTVAFNAQPSLPGVPHQQGPRWVPCGSCAPAIMKRRGVRSSLRVTTTDDEVSTQTLPSSGWNEIWLDGSVPDPYARDLVESLERGALVLELDGVASEAECQLLVNVAAHRALGENAHKSRVWVHMPLPSITAAGQSMRSFPDAADAIAEEIFQRVLAKIDDHLPSLSSRLFVTSEASDSSLVAKQAAGLLEFYPDEPAIYVYRAGGAFGSHQDMQSITMALTLSSPTSFTGGGTGFWRGDATNEPEIVLRPALGTVLLWGEDAMHSGVAVESGMRFVYIASFSARGRLGDGF